MSIESWIYTQDGDAVMAYGHSTIRYHVTCDVCGRKEQAPCGTMLPPGWHMLTVDVAPPVTDDDGNPFGPSREFHACDSPGCQVVPVHLTGGDPEAP